MLISVYFSDKQAYPQRECVYAGFWDNLAVETQVWGHFKQSVLFLVI